MSATVKLTDKTVTMKGGTADLTLDFDGVFGPDQMVFLLVTVPRELWNGPDLSKKLGGQNATVPVDGVDITGAPASWSLVARKPRAKPKENIDFYFSNVYAPSGQSHQAGHFPSISNGAKVALKLPLKAEAGKTISLDFSIRVGTLTVEQGKIEISAPAAASGGGAAAAPVANAPHLSFVAKTVSGGILHNTSAIPKGSQVLIAWKVTNATAEQATLTGALPGNSTTMVVTPHDFGNSPENGAVSVMIYGAQPYDISVLVKDAQGKKSTLNARLSFDVVGAGDVSSLDVSPGSAIPYQPVTATWSAANAKAASVTASYPPHSGLSSRSVSANPDASGQAKGSGSFLAPATGDLTLKLHVTEKTGRTFETNKEVTVSGWTINGGAKGLPSGWPWHAAFGAGLFAVTVPSASEYWTCEIYSADVGRDDRNLGWQFQLSNVESPLAIADRAGMADGQGGFTVLAFGENSLVLRELIDSKPTPVSLPESDDLLDGLKAPHFARVGAFAPLTGGFTYDGSLGIASDTGLALASVVDASNNSGFAYADTRSGQMAPISPYNSSISLITPDGDGFGDNMGQIGGVSSTYPPKPQIFKSGVLSGQEVKAMYSTSNGGIIVVGGVDTVQVYDPNGQLIFNQSDSGAVASISAWDGRGGNLYIGTSGGYQFASFKVTCSGNHIEITNNGLSQRFSSELYALRTVSNGAIVGFFADRSIAVYDGGTLQHTYYQMPSGAKIESYGTRNNGPFLGIGGEDGTVAVYLATTGQLVQSMQAHKDAVRNVAFSDCGTVLITTDDAEMVQWRRMPFQLANAGELVFIVTPDGKALSYNRKRASLSIHRGATGAQLAKLGTSAYLLDPAAGTLTRFSPDSGAHDCASLPDAAKGHPGTLTAIGSHLYYVTNGSFTVGTYGTPVPQDLRYDPATNVWAPCGHGLTGWGTQMAARSEEGAARLFAVSGAPMGAEIAMSMTVATMAATATAPYYDS